MPNEVAVIKTRLGDVVVETNATAAPLTSKNFLKLAREGFYNQTTFHRVIPDFMIQGGDPNSKNADKSQHGRGGPGYTVAAEIKLPHRRGSVATARLGDSVNPEKESSGSQFFINLKDNHFLDGNYTVFGQVLKGMEVVDQIALIARDQNDNPLERVEMHVMVVSKEELNLA